MILAAFVREKNLEAGEDLIRQGDRPWESALLLEGFAGRYKVQADGGRQITSLHVRGDFVDLHGFLLKTMDHSVVALTPCTFATIAHDTLQRITVEHPHLARLLWLTTLVDGAIHREWLTQMGAGQAYRRTVHFFCEIYMRLNFVGRTEGHSFAFPITQVDLADMLGISPVHMNRVLMELREHGLVTWRGGTLTINGWDRLQELAQFDRTYLNPQHEPR